MGATESRGPDGDRGDLQVMRRVAAAMFGVGSAASGLGALVTQATPAGRERLLATAGFLLASALALLAVRRPSRRLLEGSVLWSLALVGVVLAVAEPIGQAAAFSLWPVVCAAYFSSRRVLVVTFGWMLVTLTVGVSLNDAHETKFDTIASTAMTVGVMAWVVATMTEREAGLRRDLALAADTDPLTGLLNRRSFDPLLDQLVRTAAASSQPLSVVMFDLDHFKALNDEHGHPAGDRALQAVATVLRTQSRDGDLVSRFGGEEFAVALPGASIGEAQSYADRVAAALDQLHEAAALSTSAGISALGPGCSTAESLLARADQCLYAAKASGRDRHASWEGRIVVASPFEHAS